MSLVSLDLPASLNVTGDTALPLAIRRVTITQLAPLFPTRPTGSFLSLGAMANGIGQTPPDEPLSPQRRDTAEGCRDRATSSREHADTMVCGNDRKIIEDSAASWSARADLLQRLETAARALLSVAVVPLSTAIRPIVIQPRERLNRECVFHSCRKWEATKCPSIRPEHGESGHTKS